MDGDAGTHPELLHLTQLIELRRTTKIELARKWLEGLEGDYERRRVSEEHTAWNWWTVSWLFRSWRRLGADCFAGVQNGRADLRTTMLDEANSKRRKLDREKRFIDRPKESAFALKFSPVPRSAETDPGFLSQADSLPSLLLDLSPKSRCSIAGAWATR